MIPHELREEIYREHGIYIEGDLCPACRQMVRDQYQGRVEDVVVQRIAFSEKNRVGIGTFTPSDPKSQDISELTGSVEQVTGVQKGRAPPWWGALPFCDCICDLGPMLFGDE